MVEWFDPDDRLRVADLRAWSGAIDGPRLRSSVPAHRAAEVRAVPGVPIACPSGGSRRGTHGDSLIERNRLLPRSQQTTGTRAAIFQTGDPELTLTYFDWRTNNDGMIRVTGRAARWPITARWSHAFSLTFRS